MINAHLVPFNSAAPSRSPLRRNPFHVRRRTSSNAFVAQPTTWNGSRHSTAFGAFAFTTDWIQFNPANPFSPKGFFQTLDDNASRSIGAVRSPRGSEVARHFKPEIEEADKIYFLSWLEHIDDGCHASPENKEKTRPLLGQEFFEMCDRGNVSSRWTADRTKERPEIQPPSRHTDPTVHA